ncbi:dienelactone hydrolase family protein [Nocardiopsis dassonvillei]|uniref:Dienelactone hydrolase n=1 Tax=Nocardiopsis dassonvillei (strain ATCC 23218 / DSM 43111 / CIP 107115 / JCM 7437 / KCTC 9190 / NBRC 14626 / NCTC 10488 / NRRL B-5397 / IMRU 509) TaxID=446468 RepID=D7B210_NOCDD|nr:alpha/beta family hydrolase [Nocardiopsis dassonvillei]ADH66631.1 dienelactone hydrolase [Nocardiopsis dassonvillei subsp. dassonvillei DSM 43111]NKY78948.1 alpha/beta hydrolase [Nocardiopsis dassonvillei]VEI92653.1 Predicted dienelactone hydrolase [Nocardiopsis dassonvillei]
MTAVDVTVRTPDALLDGRLAVFPGATAVVAFAHGSGSSRHSPRNRAVAEELNRVGVATLLLDLLTPEEERADSATGRQRFDIDLLTRRLIGTVDWLAGHEDTAGTPIGLFGASTGAAAALRTAAERPDLVAAVVSRGGRPDLAGTEALQVVRAPTLLIVGGADTEVLRLNEDAADRLSAPHRIHVVPRATHLFEEPGALEEVADAASGWFAGILGEAER